MSVHLKKKKHSKQFPIENIGIEKNEYGEKNQKQTQVECINREATATATGELIQPFYRW